MQDDLQPHRIRFRLNPEPLSSSCPWLSVRVSSHIVGARRVLPVAFSLAPTRPTVMAAVHTVSVGPAVSSYFTDVFPVHPLGVCLDFSVHWYPGPHVLSCVYLLEFLG